MSLERYEILNGEVRRRHWPQSLKEEIVSETLIEGTTVTQVARRRGIDRSLIYRWRRELKVSRRWGRSDVFVPVQVAESSGPVVKALEDEAPAPAGLHDASPAAVAGRMEIVLGRGRRITVFADVDAAALARVVGVLGVR